MRRGRRLLELTLLTALLPGVAGCFACFHPLAKPHHEQVAPCQEVPKCCRDHVYVFLLNGLDPTNYGNMTGLRDYLNCLGFHKTYYGQIYHVCYFQDEIRRLHRDDPDAHFVLVGFSLGANLVCDIASGVADDGVHIDLMVLLSGNHLVKSLPEQGPPNVGRTVSLLTAEALYAFGDRPWAENWRLTESTHFQTPTHHVTQELLQCCLLEMASAVPMADVPEAPGLPLREEAPTPRPVETQAAAPVDAWDFLKPVSRLRQSNVPGTAPAAAPEAPAQPASSYIRAAFESWRQMP